MISKRKTMTIRYSNGHTLEAVLLNQTENSMRIALRHSDDVLELRHTHGAWVTEDCEPVQVEYAWSGEGLLEEISEDECICSPELAAKLLRLLFSGEEQPEVGSPAPRPAHVPLYQHVV